MKIQFVAGAALLFSLGATPASAINTTASSDANAMAAALAGTGIAFSGATLTGNSQNGFFSNGTAGTGLDHGVILTTGGLDCAGSVNTTGSCTGGPNGATNAALTLSFTAQSTELFFNYVFASEEYNTYANSTFNDTFSLLLNGAGFSDVNLAQLPGGAGEVTINNVNLSHNAFYYRNNNTEATGTTGATAPSLNLPIQYDGLTTVLTASATGLVVGSSYSLTFNISDVGDSSFDSAVFIQGGTVGTEQTPVPEPAMLGLFGLGAVGLGFARRRRAA